MNTVSGKPSRISAARGFTLLELILVIAIVGLLSTLLFPAITTMGDRARSLKCANHLRQIGASAHLYANEHENRFPRIEVDPDEPIYPPEENVKPILETLQAYGVTEAVLQCEADLRGPTGMRNARQATSGTRARKAS
jgi:prepilin-type N-terminal cleavage/methylation domain-containing protein